jgi:NRAMP (natural resistance-associated macrophage protein)-like metal ion transporter
LLLSARSGQGEFVEQSKKKEPAASGKDGLLKRLGPGLITGASDDDPSGIGTYSQAGAQLGFGISWTMLLTYPLMVAIQEISGRIGRVTGHGLAGNVCRNYPSPIIWSLVVLLFIANTINVAADLGAMADATKVLIGGWSPLYVVVYAVVSVAAQVFLNYKRYVAILKWLTLVLFAYVIALFIVHVPWSEALRGLLIPKIQFNGAFLTTLIAILGTTISPYLFVWQSSQEAEEQRIDPDKKPSGSIRKQKTRSLRASASIRSSGWRSPISLRLPSSLRRRRRSMRMARRISRRQRKQRRR